MVHFRSDSVPWNKDVFLLADSREAWLICTAAFPKATAWPITLHADLLSFALNTSTISFMPTCLKECLGKFTDHQCLSGLAKARQLFLELTLLSKRAGMFEMISGFVSLPGYSEKFMQVNLNDKTKSQVKHVHMENAFCDISLLSWSVKV